MKRHGYWLDIGSRWSGVSTELLRSTHPQARHFNGERSTDYDRDGGTASGTMASRRYEELEVGILVTEEEHKEKKTGRSSLSGKKNGITMRLVRTNPRKMC